MIIEIQHETRFEYSEPARESTLEVRMEPVSDAEQSCHSFHLAFSPPAEPARYLDGFGNRVHSFNILAPHSQVSILAAGIVETHPTIKALLTSSARYPLDPDKPSLEALGFLKLGGPARPTPLLQPLLTALAPTAGKPLGEFLLEICNYVHTNFEYAPDVTLVHSPIDDLLRSGKGVCQDFTHLLIAILRSFDVPARYVSGYIHRPGKESQSHAWCEAWLPELGWIGLDPTNDLMVNEYFIKVAIGRDFTDVPPNKGVYRGRGTETISVRVETRELDRLPSLSWQEQLPPLNIPLTAIVGNRPPDPDDDGQMQQQQQ
jgi:transglutaminase-like putative cysteine protease